MPKEIKNAFVYMQGFAGNLGTKIIIEKRRDDLLRHFTNGYLLEVEKKIKDGFSPSFVSIKEIDSESIGKGGVLAALWKLCDRNKFGLNYRLCDMPILQGTIEISNFFDLNPYRLLTSDAKLIISSDKIENEKEVNDCYSFRCIGEITRNKKRVRVDSESESFLTKYYRDEIDKIFNG